MKVSQLLEQRRVQWGALETLCTQMERRGVRALGPDSVARFAALYRAACADLALADAYQLPPPTVQYLHHLVGRGYNQLYRSRGFNLRSWGREMFREVPRRLFRDRCFWLALALFYGVFAASMLMAVSSPQYAERTIGAEAISHLEEMYDRPPHDRQPEMSGLMTGFYIWNNAGIGLQCFAGGLLLGVGGLLTTLFNGMFLGAVFGHMLTTPQWENFSQFVTAHGPFELTAIALSAAAGMRMGFALIDTRGRTRVGSLRRAATDAVPSMGAAVALFCLAAMIESFVSPSAAPYWVKAGVALASVLLLVVYIVGLGHSGRPADAVR